MVRLRSPLVLSEAAVPMPLFTKFRQAIERHQLIHKNDAIVIGVSGGPDSVCLLYLLKSLQKELGLMLHIAHLNHSLRGKDSQQDAEFVRELAEKLKLPATFKEAAVRNPSQKGSLEEIARKVRFDFLFEVARKTKAKKIALGHNLDDQAETVLMRIVRGSGLMGLSGILPRRKMGGCTIIRPLLAIQRSEIEQFLKAKRIVPRIDHTNQQGIYFRNRIRHKLLPELKRYNANIKEVLANMAESIALDYGYISENARKAYSSLKKGKSRIQLPLIAFLKLHPSLQNMLLRLAFEELKGDTRRLAYQHIKELRDLIDNRPYGAIVDLPSQISMSKNRKYLRAYLHSNK